MWFGSKKTYVSENEPHSALFRAITTLYVGDERFFEWWSPDGSWSQLLNFHLVRYMDSTFYSMYEIKLFSHPNQEDTIFLRKSNIPYKIVCIGSSFIYL